MAKRHEIELHIEDDQAQRVAARQQQQQAKIERDALRAAAAQERAAQRAAVAQERAAQRAADAAAVAAKKTADAQARQAQRTADVQAHEAKKTADYQARQAQRAADQQAREAKRAADAVVREAQRAADQQARAVERAAAAQARVAQRAVEQQQRNAQRAQDRITAMAGRALTDEEARAKALGSIQQRLNDRRVAGALKTAEKERWAAMSIKEKFADIGATIADRVNPGALAFGAATTAAGLAVGHLVKHWQEVAQGIETAIDFQRKYRDLLPENAAVKGRLGDTTQEVKETLALRSRTLQTAQEAKDFEGGLMNSGQVAVEAGRISQMELNRLKVEAGSFQATEGGNATTHGELAGSLPALMTPRRDAAGKEIPLTAEDVMGEQWRLYDIMQLGRSTFTSGIDQLLKNSSLTQTGAFDSIGQQMALQSAFSNVDKEKSGEMVNWLNRATVGNVRDKEIGGYFQKLSVGREKKSLPIADAVARDLANQQKNAQASGQQFSAYDYLSGVGFQNQEDIKALSAYASLQESGKLQKYLDRATAPADAQKLRDFVAGGRADPRMQARSAEVGKDVRQFNYDRAHATADAFRRQIFAEMQPNNPTLSGTFEDVEKDQTYSKQRLLQAGMNAALQRSAKTAGIPLAELPWYNPMASQLNLDRPVQAAIDQLHAAKVDPFAQSLSMTTAQMIGNLDAAGAAEAPARRGLALGAADRQARRLIEDQQIGAGQLMAGPRPIDLVGSMPPRPGLSFREASMARLASTMQASPASGAGFAGVAGNTDGITTLLRQLLTATQQTLEATRQAEQRKAQRDRDLANKAKTGTVSGPLPIQGPGRINPRP